MEQSKVSIIIVNWNGKHLLKECLSSVEKQDYDNFNIIFVDNGSKDKSVEFVRENFLDVNIIELKENTGFAKGNNIGMHKAFDDLEVEYIAILNTDAMVESQWLSEMMTLIDNDDKVGSVAPKIKKYYKRNIIDSIGNAIHLDGGGVSNHINKVDNGQYNSIKEVFGPSGCAALYSREMLEDIQMGDDFFDDDFFAYFEDIDLNWRARLRGWKSLFASNAVVYHKHSESVGLYSPFKAFYTNRNRYFVIIKNYSLFLFPKAILYLFLGYFYSVFSIAGNKGPSARLLERSGFFEVVKIVIRGWIDIIKYLPAMFKKRSYIMKNKKISNKEVKKFTGKYVVNLKEIMYSEHIK
ncbi:MAG: glycosyltransferase family 2 protein [Candidatus Pacebacteria bacterium]|nr:glycosyltransferase family 2 protein [Candidatus Paceibacterota bacterium]